MPFALNVLTFRGSEIADVTAFIARSSEPLQGEAQQRLVHQPVPDSLARDLFVRFGLPERLARSSGSGLTSASRRRPCAKMDRHMPLFGGRQRPSQEEQEAAEVDLERIRGGGIPLGAAQRLGRIGESDAPLFTSDLSSKEYALAQASGLQPVAQVMGSSVVKHGYQNYGWANYNYGGITSSPPSQTHGTCPATERSGGWVRRRSWPGQTR